MAERNLTYFVSDVHLGLRAGDPGERERRFEAFLKSIPGDTAESLYLLGDIWDFWYEYKDVVPAEGTRIIAQILRLIDAGVKVYFLPGNHDIWCYRHFERLGIVKIQQPYFTEIGGKTFCLGHGDAIGGASFSYGLMKKIFYCRPLQVLFSTLHPTLAFRIGNGWSSHNRKSHGNYSFIPEKERIVQWAKQQDGVDYFIFGHYHVGVDLALENGARFVILDAWFNSSPYLCFDGKNLISSSSF